MWYFYLLRRNNIFRYHALNLMPFLKQKCSRTSEHMQVRLNILYCKYLIPEMFILKHLFSKRELKGVDSSSLFFTNQRNHKSCPSLKLHSGLDVQSCVSCLSCLSCPSHLVCLLSPPYLYLSCSVNVGTSSYNSSHLQ